MQRNHRIIKKNRSSERFFLSRVCDKLLSKIAKDIKLGATHQTSAILVSIADNDELPRTH
jgi:hypothetical protein